jgi:hypothetical protein
MGAMPCYRKNCNSIFCNRYSGEYGYICGDCFYELSDLIYKNRTKGIKTDINRFMCSSKEQEDFLEDNEENIRKQIEEKLENIFQSFLIRDKR